MATSERLGTPKEPKLAARASALQASPDRHDASGWHPPDHRRTGRTATLTPVQDFLSGDRDSACKRIGAFSAPVAGEIPCAGRWLHPRHTIPATQKAGGGRRARHRWLPLAGKFAGPRRFQNRIEQSGCV